MENLALLVPLVILIPAIGALLNVFWGARLGESWIATIAVFASALTFGVVVLLYLFLNYNYYQGVIVDPPVFNSWITIPGANLNIPWQQRVDSLSLTMMLIVTGIGTLIHVYSIAYMKGDERYHRYFAYMNMFLAFMLLLVSANNYVMMFVGWEGVGLCSFLLIGFWFDRDGVAWRNSLAARKAFIMNRIGDFGVIMSMILMFAVFGTFTYYTPGEVASPTYNEHLVEEIAHEAELAAPAEGEAAAVHAEAAPSAEGEHNAEAIVPAEGEQAAEGEHGEEAAPEILLSNDHIAYDQLGVFGRAERLLEQGGDVQVGPFTMSIGTAITLITLFLLLGATGKSAQIPLMTWLPDAMAGPTPASALIHAATMVTAGVYIMVRSNVLYEASGTAMAVVALVGATTALVAGFIAVGQWDIKRVLAYSTVSQLGFMVAAVGVGAFGAAIFHLVTHAFFKALLFLASGSVIHGVEHGHHHAHAHGHGDEPDHGHEHAEEAPFDPQDMRNMGGLRKKMPVTYLVYLAGALALIGIFPMAGFWSKDEILADAWNVGLLENNVVGYIVDAMLFVAVAFTAFYMWRQIVLVFHGKPRTEAAELAPESSKMMLFPMIVLAFFSIFGGFMNTPSGVLGLDGLFGAHELTVYLESSIANAHAGEFVAFIAIASVVLAIVMMVLANRVYSRVPVYNRRRDPLEMLEATQQVWRFAHARMYWDEFYDRVFVNPFRWMAAWLSDELDGRFLHDWVHNTVFYKGFNAVGRFLAHDVDVKVVDGAVNGVGRLTRWGAGELRKSQTGYVRIYAISLFLGVVVVVLVLLLPLLQRG
ncbi:MAG TPA: proton-conducting transporter membrane subunit [Candidatus Limnocylindrales bacterium]|nr:proton-conducting transporter membrane subunit [Candidatus Limnocylindrales bacterium]